jgi:ribonuclease Z
MKIGNNSVECSLVNGIQGDPSVYCFFVQTGEAALFDLGSLEALTHKDLLRVRHVFVSHTHIDHFIGFDRWLRVNIPHGRRLEVSGPPGIIENVRGKIAGYLWNLLEPDQIEFVVHELAVDGSVKSALISNSHQFVPQPIPPEQPMTGPTVRPLPQAPAAFITNLKDKARIEAVCLDHGTPSVAYLCQSALRFAVNIDEIQRLGLSPGPWIRELQLAVANAEFDKVLNMDAGKTFVVRDLSAQVLTATAPRLLGYLTDIKFSSENLERVADLMNGVELLVCECNFSEEDFQKAFQKKHLTTKQAAMIAAYLQADQLQVFHISNIYAGKEQDIADEAQRFFKTYRPLDKDSLMKLIASEQARIRT